VVVTSSFASILDEAHLVDPTIFTEKSWNPVTIDDINRSQATAYRASKKLAERASWDFVANNKPNFALSTICPPLVLGPVVHHLSTLESINTSNSRVVDLVKGKWKDAIPDTGAAYLWLDVRDCAEAHIRAFEKEEAKGKRLFTTAGYFCNRDIADALRKTDKFPEFKDRIPAPDVKGGEMPPKDGVYGYDNSATEKILGIEWISLDKSIVDLVETLKGFDL
jgi:nucleoside-diphosphate-sugar epimerase